MIAVSIATHRQASTGGGFRWEVRQAEAHVSSLSPSLWRPQERLMFNACFDRFADLSFDMKPEGEYKR
jgi:hypothetical protein